MNDTTNTARDTMNLYMSDVRATSVLPDDQQRDLALRAQRGDERARDTLIRSNLRLVVKIAAEYNKRGTRLSDLVQEGNIGLIHAVGTYDPDRKVVKDGEETDSRVKFTSYASYWIRAFMLRYMINTHRIVKLGTTTSQRKLFFKMGSVRRKIQSMGGDGTDAEVAAVMGVSEDEVRIMESRMRSEKSMESPLSDDEGASTFGESMEGDAPTPEEAVSGEYDRASVRDAVAAYRATLKNEKEIAVLDRRIMADEPQTLQEIADTFGISRERMRQLEERVMGGLRLVLADYR